MNLSALKHSQVALAVLSLGAVLCTSAQAQTYQHRWFTPGMVVLSSSGEGGGTQPPNSPAPPLTYALDASSLSLSFGQTELGQNSIRSVELVNRGTGVLELDLLSTTGSAFASQTNCAGTLAVGASCQAQVTFTPTASGEYTGQLSVPSNATSGVLNISLSGMGVPLGTLSGLLVASPSSVSFSDTQVGATRQVALTLTNSGAAALNLGSPSVSGAQFSVQASTCPGTLQPGASCVLTVQFAPDSTALAQGQVRVPNDGPAGALSASLQGTGYTVSASVAAVTTADFGSVNVGNLVSRSFTFTNTGTRTLTQAYAQASGTDFTLTANTCGSSGARLSLAPGQSCQVTATFAPTSGGTPSNWVELFASELAGSVRQDAPATAVGFMTASASSFNFGSVNVGSSSAASVVTLTNTTGATRTLSIGAAPTGYTRSTTCGATLANKASCTVSITFAPMTAATLAGTLSITTDTTSHPVSVTGLGLMNSALLTPNYSLFYEGKHPAWLETGHAWASTTSGYVTNAPGGAGYVQGLVVNATSVNRVVTLYYAVDDVLGSLKLNGVAQPLPACSGHTNLCSVNITLPPGTSRLNMEPTNGAGPAGFSAWVVDSGTVLLSTSNTSGAKAWTRH